MHRCMWYTVHALVWGGHQVTFQLFSILVFETGSLVELGTYRCSWAPWSMSFRHPCMSSFPGLGLQKCATTHSICVGVGDLDSGPQVCVATPLPAEPPHPCTGLASSKH